MQTKKKDSNDWIKKTSLIKAIPQGKHTEEEIYSLVDKIKGGQINSEAEITGQGSGGARQGAGRRPTATIRAYVKLTDEEKLERKEARAKTIQYLKDNDKAKAKKQAELIEAKKLKKKEAEQPYFKADEPKKGFREATMLEASKDKKIMLWGKKKADSKLVKAQFETGKPLKERKEELQLKIAGRRGLLSRMIREIKLLKDDSESKAKKVEEYQHELKLVKDLNQELLTINDKIAKDNE